MGIFNHSKNEDNEPLVACDNCKQLFPKSKLRKCRKCGAVLCPKCQKTHVCPTSAIPPTEEAKRNEEKKPDTKPIVPDYDNMVAPITDSQIVPDASILKNSDKSDFDNLIDELIEELKPKLIGKLRGVSEDDFDDKFHDLMDFDFEDDISDKVSDYLSDQSSPFDTYTTDIAESPYMEYRDIDYDDLEINPNLGQELTDKVKKIIEKKLYNNIFKEVVQNSEIDKNDDEDDFSWDDGFGYESDHASVYNAQIKRDYDDIFHLDDFDAEAYNNKLDNFSEFCDNLTLKVKAGIYSEALADCKVLLSLNPADALLKLGTLFSTAMLSAILESNVKATEFLREALTLEIFVTDIVPLTVDVDDIDNMYNQMLELKNKTIDVFNNRDISIPQTVFSNQIDPGINLNIAYDDIDLSDITHNLYLSLGIAENGDRFAQEELALCYFCGWGVDKNIQKGLYWLEKSYSSGIGNRVDPTFQGFALMGRNYERGITVEKDIKKAISWYEKGAKNNDAPSMWSLGIIYYFGHDVPKDLDKAIPLITRAAELGLAEAENTLGFLYSIGKDIEQDFTKAFYWWTKAAEQEFPKAIANLGTVYEKGEGVAQDITHAVELYRKSANYSDPLGMCNLGNCYLEGIGVTQDYQEGFNWFLKASETADEGSYELSAAQYYIGCCYYNGYGVVKSKIKAREWIEKSIQGDNEDALAFAEEHPDLNLGNISSNISATYHITGDLIQDNHGIIAKDEAIVNRAHVAKDDSRDAGWEMIKESTLPSASQMNESKISFCPECGKPVDEDAKFCKYCGRKLI